MRDFYRASRDGRPVFRCREVTHDCERRLGQDPREVATRTGKAMTVARLAVDVARDDAGAPPLWLVVVAFGRVAETLAAQPRRPCERVRARAGQGKAGAEREQSKADLWPPRRRGESHGGRAGPLVGLGRGVRGHGAGAA